MSEEAIKNESLNDNKLSISRLSRISSSKLQPERIMLKVEMMVSDDEEDSNENDDNYNNDNVEEEEIDKNIDEDVEESPKLEELNKIEDQNDKRPAEHDRFKQESRNIKDFLDIKHNYGRSEQEHRFNYEKIDKCNQLKPAESSVDKFQQNYQRSHQEKSYSYDKIDENNELKSTESSVSNFMPRFSRPEVHSRSLATHESVPVSEIGPKYMGSVSRPSGSISELSGDAVNRRLLSSSHSGDASSISAGVSSLSIAGMPFVSVKNQKHDLLTNQKHEGSVLQSIYANKASNINYQLSDAHHPVYTSMSHDSYIHPVQVYKPEAAVTSSSALQSAFNPPVTSFKCESTFPASVMSQPMSQPTINQTNISHNTSSSQLPMETPIKNHPPAGSMRPLPSYSHRSIFQTPQNKIPGNYTLNQSYAPTPATIFSHWQNVMHTPQDTPNEIPGQSVKRPYWSRNTDGKGVRRPLAETMSQEHRSSGNAKVDLQSHQDHQETPRLFFDKQHQQESQRHLVLENKSVAPKDLCKNRMPLENLNRLPDNQNRPLEAHRGLSERKYVNNSILQESKENRYPVIENSLKKDELEAAEIVNDNEINQAKPNSVVKELYANMYNAGNANIVASVASSIKKPQTGKMLTVKDKNYIILGKLGEGMSGEVFRVQDTTTSELRAIKCVNLLKMDKENAQSCIQEVTMLSKLQGPSIIEMFDYELKDSTIYVVMEMGDTDLNKLLKSIITENGLPLTMILYYWTEMLSAVKFIHDHGVIHSDLKPANFLLVRGRLKLIDFGIASSLNADMTSVLKNSTVGTLNYISPEALVDVGETVNQHGRFKISYKSDVWSLGCILYQLVYGRTPYYHIRQQWAKINAIANPETKVSYTQAANSNPIPPILIDVMKKCLQHNPKARPSVEQLLQIHYIPIGNQSNVPDIPPNIIVKIKNSLDDVEWRQFIETIDQRRNL